MADERAAQDLTPPQLPEPDVMDAEEVIAEAPSPEQVIQDAEPVERILEGQPSVDDVLGR